MRALPAGRRRADCPGSRRCGADAVGDLADVPLLRVLSRPLLLRMFELRFNVTAYDAVYVALAEAAEATLLTADRRLAGAPGTGCRVEVLG